MPRHGRVFEVSMKPAFFAIGALAVASCKGHDKPASAGSGGSAATQASKPTSGSSSGPKVYVAPEGFEIAFAADEPTRLASSPDDVRYESVADEMKRRGLSMPPVSTTQYLDGSQHDADKQYGVAYYVYVEDFGPAAASRSAVLLDERAKELAAHDHVTLHPLQYAGMQGLEGAYDEATSPGRPPIHDEVRVFAAGGKVFLLMADEQGGADPDHAARKRFFESFKLTTPP
jgi:hypothetical protein